MNESPQGPAGLPGSGTGRFQALVREADAPRALKLLADWHAEVAAESPGEPRESRDPDS